MTLIEIEKLAASSAPLPPGLNQAEQYAFLCMRILYIQYAKNEISIEQAKTEKMQIVHEYSSGVLACKCWEQALERERRLSVLSPELKNSGCELCRKYARVLAGLKESEENNE